MKKNEINAKRGLAIIGMHEKCYQFSTVDQTTNHVRMTTEHPLGLDTPGREPGMGAAMINFLTTQSAESTVEAFMTHVRESIGYTNDSGVQKLRVISIPVKGGQPAQNYVFFEIWTVGRVTISGYTTDYSGSGNTAREKLEDVFAAIRMFGPGIHRFPGPNYFIRAN